MEKIAFIGMGNMAQALTGGFIKAGKIEPKNIFAYAPNQQKLAQNAAKYGFIPCASLKEAVSKAQEKTFEEYFEVADTKIRDIYKKTIIDFYQDL